MAEQQTFDFGQWQHALDAAAGFGEEKEGAMAKSALDDGLPAGPMKKGRFTATGYELVPTRDISGLQLRHPN